MKKTKRKGTDELRSEYKRSDFGNIVRGKYAARVAEKTNIVILEREAADTFPNDRAVNEALRGLLKGATTAARVPKPSTGRAKQRRAC